jgi:predicted nuclease of predicted toxin-antitoxin system
MSLKFIADVHISPITVAELRKSGYQIYRVTDYLPAHAKDSEIIKLARCEKAIIITPDLDFSALIAKSGLSQPSVISLRVGNVKPSVISSILKMVLPLIEKELEAGAIVSVEESQYRVRKLPI